MLLAARSNRVLVALVLMLAFFGLTLVAPAPNTEAGPVAAVQSVLAAPDAEAHEGYCGHGDHYSGHSSYLIKFEREYTSSGGYVWHTVSKWTDRTWYGSYPTFVKRYDIVGCH